MNCIAAINEEHVDIFSYCAFQPHTSPREPKGSQLPPSGSFCVQTCSNNPNLLFWTDRAEEVSARDLTRATTAHFFFDSGNGESPLFLSAWTWWLLEVLSPLLLLLRLLLLGAEEPSCCASDYERRSDPHVSARALLLPRRRRFLSSFSLDAGAHISVMRSPTCWLVVVLRWVPVRDNREREYVVSPPHFY